jgi:hypothetical protein
MCATNLRDVTCKWLFSKSPSVKGLGDFTTKWGISKLTSVAFSGK